MINEREVFILIYLDNAATTKAFEEVLDTYLKVNQSMYYNPNSPHKAGLQANQLLQQAKAQINAMINSKQIMMLYSLVVQLNPIILLLKVLPIVNLIQRRK